MTGPDLHLPKPIRAVDASSAFPGGVIRVVSGIAARGNAPRGTVS